MPNPNAVEWSLLDVNFLTKLSVLPAAGGTFYIEMNEPGSGSIRIRRDSYAASLIDYGMFVGCKYRGALRGGFFVDNINPVDANQSEGEGQWVTIDGRGMLAILDDAVIWNDGTGNTSRTFTGTKAAILIALIDEAKGLGFIQNVVYDFSATVDSLGTSWTDSEDLSFPVNTPLLDVLRQFAATGVDFDMVLETNGDFTLQAFKNGKGSNKSSTVYFRTGSDIEESGERNIGSKIKNFLQLKYRDGFTIVSDAVSALAYRKRAKGINIEAAQTVSSATTYGAAKLDGMKDPEKEIAVKIYDGVAPYVFTNYETGDTITIDRFGVKQSERVRGMQMSFDEAGYAHIGITLHSTIVEKNLDMGRRLGYLEHLWDTARDAKKLEVSYWDGLDAPTISLYPTDMILVGSKLYITTTGYLLIYDITSGMWERVALDPAWSAAYCLEHVNGVIYIGCADAFVKYTISTGVASLIASVSSLLEPLAQAILYMAVIGTKLYLSGIFDHIGGNALDGAAEYDTVGDTYLDISTTGGGYRLLSNGSNLYNSLPAVWAGGTTWNALGTSPGTIIAMAAYGSGIVVSVGGQLYVWDGATWTALGDALNLNISKIAVYLTDVYAVGYFTDVGNYVARYSGGAWWALAGGLNAFANEIVLYQSNDNVDVYVGGQFTEADGKPAVKFAVYFNNFEALADHLGNSGGESFNLGEAIHNATAKTPMVAADEMPLWDSVTQQLRKVTWANILVTIGTWADLLYVKLTGNQTIAGVKTFSSDPLIPDEAYDATAWNGVLEPPTKNAVRDKIESMGGGTPGGSDTQVQYNDAGAFAGDAEFTFNKTTKVLHVGAADRGIRIMSPQGDIDIYAPDSENPIYGSHAYNGIPAIVPFVSEGTLASQAAVTLGKVLWQVAVKAYNGTDYKDTGRIRAIATENHNGTSSGMKWEIYCVSNTTNVETLVATFDQDGNVNIASGKQFQVNGAQHTHAAADITGGTTEKGGALLYVSATAYSVLPGKMNVNGTPLAWTANIARTGLTLTNATIYYIYLYNNSGTPAVEESTTVPVWDDTLNCYQKTGDATRRCIGYITTSATNQIARFVNTVIGRVSEIIFVDGVDRLVVNAGTSSAAGASFSLSPFVPVHASHWWGIGKLDFSTILDEAALGLSPIDITGVAGNLWPYVVRAKGAVAGQAIFFGTNWYPIETAQTYYYRLAHFAGTTTTTRIVANGARFIR